MKEKSTELADAIEKLDEVIAKLRLAKEALLKARHSQHISLAFKLVELE